MVGPEDVRLVRKNKWFSGWLANSYPSYDLVWSGEPDNKDSD